MLGNQIEICHPDSSIKGELPRRGTIFDGSGVLLNVHMNSRFSGGGSGKRTEPIITVGDVPPDSRALEIARNLQADGAGLLVVTDTTPEPGGEGKPVGIASTPTSKN